MSVSKIDNKTTMYVSRSVCKFDGKTRYKARSRYSFTEDPSRARLFNRRANAEMHGDAVAVEVTIKEIDQ